MSDEEFGGTGGNGLDEDVGLPKATVGKLITEMLPAELICAKEARDLIAECCVEFIHLVSGEANEACENDARKTIGGEHVLTALKTLGFEDFIPEVTEVLESHVKQSKERESRSSKLENSGMSLEELEKIQEELIAKARRNMESGQLNNPSS